MVITNPQRSMNETAAQNPDAFNPRIPRGMVRKPEYYVYIHSVSKRSWPIAHLLFPRQTLRACPPNERYVTVMPIPEPVIQVAPDEANGGRRGYEESAWRVAIDLLNPNNLSMDPYAPVNAATTTSQNCDLIRQGLWPSMNEVPNEQEIERAEKALESYYKELADRALRLESMNQRAELDDLLNSNPDVRLAMDKFGLEASFHKKISVTIPCKLCGEAIKPGLAYHNIPGVGLCVNDWQKAVAAGVKKREDVPEEARWWKGPGRPPAVAA